MTLIRQNNSINGSANTITTLDELQRKLAVQGTELTAILQDLYSIALFDTKAPGGGDIISDPRLDPSRKRANAEYFFRVPPRVHEFSEPFSTTIVPTQNGGKFVESHGSIIKEIRLSGTTGLRPNKVAPSQIPLLGLRTDQIGILLGEGLRNLPRELDPAEVTGHDDIIFLRNLFRLYSDLKSSDDLAGRTVMLWRNIKDADYWVVEPVDFRLVQNSSSPLTYEYNITFKTLAKFDFTALVGRDPLEDLRDRRRLYSRLQEYSQNLLNCFLTIATQISRLEGLGFAVTSTLLGPLSAVLQGVSAIKTASMRLVPSLIANNQRLLDGVFSALDKIAEDPVTFPPGDPLVRSLRRTVVVASKIKTEASFRESVEVKVTDRRDRAVGAYATAGGLVTPRSAPATGGSPSYIGSERTPSAVGYSTVRAGEDLRTIAWRLLGDRSRWHILALINDLRAPYIGATAEPGVLIPGDTILYPLAEGVASSTVTTSSSAADMENQDINVSSPVQQAYGRDIRLQSLSESGTEVTDVAVNQRGDIGTIQGIPNVDQAVRVKFATEQGELTVHPNFGAKFPIGRKATPSSFSIYRVNALQTFFSDQRVKDVKEIKFLTVGDVLVVEATVILRHTNDILTLDFALRRF